MCISHSKMDVVKVPNFPPLAPPKPKYIVNGVPIFPYQSLNLYSPDLQIVGIDNSISFFVPSSMKGGSIGPTGPAGPPGPSSLIPGPTGPSVLDLLTTKGDLLTYSDDPVRLPVGTDNQVLTSSTIPTWSNEMILNRLRVFTSIAIGQPGNDLVISGIPSSPRIITIPEEGTDSSLILSTSISGQSISNQFVFGSPVTFPAPFGGTSVPFEYSIRDYLYIGIAGEDTVPSSVLPVDIPDLFVIQINRVGSLVSMNMNRVLISGPDPGVTPYIRKPRGELPSLSPLPPQYRPSADIVLSTNGNYWETFYGGPLPDPESMMAQPLQWKCRIGADGFFTFLVTGDTDAEIILFQWPSRIGVRACSMSWSI